MSARDPVVVILAGLERPVAPRPEFADALLGRLLEELRESRVPTGKAWRPRLRLPRILPGAPPRLRLALIVLALLLLLAGIATATYFGVKTWISAGPRGVQYTSDFRLVELARGVEYGRITLAPNGDELYGISMPTRHAQPDLRRAAIVQVSGLRGERVRSDVALRLLDLKQNAALWDPGADLSGLVVPEIFTVHEFSPKPSIAPNGDLAFVASVSPATTLSSFFKSGAKSTSLLVRHRDGKVEKVLTVRELVAAGLLNPAAAEQANMLFAVAFSAPDRLFLYVNDEPGRNRFRSVYEVVDPNGDGDWSDRKVTPLALPAFLGFDRPITDARSAWYVKVLAAESSIGGDDRSRSFLLLVTRFGVGENRVYRVSDANGDGDALDAGELVRVFSGTPTGEFESVMAPRAVVRDGKVVRRELLLGGFSTRTRVSRVSEAGEVVDVTRAFFRIDDVAADPEGAIYVLAIPPGGGTPSLFKLAPVPEGTAPKAGAASAESTAPVTTATTATTATTRRALRIAVGWHAAQRAEFFVMGTNGRRLGKLFSGGPNGTSLGPQSPDGSRFVYSSDEEIPNEPFTYVRLAGGKKTKIAEKYREVVCWISMRSLLLGDDPPALSVYDLATGRETTLLEHAYGACTSDRHFAVVVTGFGTVGGVAALELMNLRTHKRRRLVAEPPGADFNDWAVSADGRHLAYTIEHVVGPPEHRRLAGTYEVYLVDLATGKTTRVLRVRRSLVGVYSEWAPTSDRLLLRISHKWPCTKEKLKPSDNGRCQSWTFAFVEVRSGKLRTIASTPKALNDPVWSPDGRQLAYSTGRGVSLVRVDGATRRLPLAAGYILDFGWSPDGRYLGLARSGNVGNPKTGLWTGVPVEIALLDVATGKVRTLMNAPKGVWLEPKWWR